MWVAVVAEGASTSAQGDSIRFSCNVSLIVLYILQPLQPAPWHLVSLWLTLSWEIVGKVTRKV